MTKAAGLREEEKAGTWASQFPNDAQKRQIAALFASIQLSINKPVMLSLPKHLYCLVGLLTPAAW
jgi:hypothetical protein